MARFDKATGSALVKLLIFIVVTTMATGVLVVLIGNITFQKSTDYKAVFSDTTGVVKGDDIRIAGVKVGSVSSVEVVDRTRALVSFSVSEDAAVTRASQATVKFRNLVGQRYISLTQGVGASQRMPAGSTIPISRTHPALDLTVLFNGFKPLFQALSPADINQLSYEIVKIFQGEGGTLEGLLRSTADVTTTLANRDQIIGQLITNLNHVLVTVSNREGQLNTLITRLRDLLTGLARDRNALLGPLNSISDLTVQTADLVTGIRPSFVKDVKGLRRTAGNIQRGRGELDRALQVLPIKLTKIGRTAIYGSFFNFYLCQFTGRVRVAGQVNLPSLKYNPGANDPRCHLS